MNKVELIGNIGKDGVKLTDLESGKAVANFSLATNEKYIKDGKEQQVTDWHNVKAWEKVGKESAEKFNKGSFIKVTGKLKTDMWEDKDGKKRSSVYVLANKIEEVQTK